MSWSLGEITALCTKAARGAGKPWGLAEEAGWAVRWLAERGLPGPEAFAAYLSSREGPCPVTVGASMADTGAIGLMTDAGAIAEPLLLVPFLSRLAPTAKALQVDAAGQGFLVWDGETDLSCNLAQGAQLRVVGEAASGEACSHTQRIEAIVPEALAVLEGFAGRTYAPATEASRAKGAGAGLTDND